MDVALDMHHSIIRALMAKHNGYECATEGDRYAGAC